MRKAVSPLRSATAVQNFQFARSLLRQLVHPIADVIASSRLAVRAGGKQIVAIRVMLAGILVNVFVAPWIHRNFFKIWSVPVGCATRLLQQFNQTIAAFWISTIVHLE